MAWSLEPSALSISVFILTLSLAVAIAAVLRLHHGRRQRRKALPVPPSNDVFSGVVAIDVGSSSVRATAYRMLHQQGGEKLQRLGFEQDVGSAIDAAGEGDARRLRLRIEKALDALCATLRRDFPGMEVAVVGAATFAMNLVGVDARGKPTTPLHTYASRSAGAIAAVTHLQATEDEAAYHQRTGCVFHTSYALAQMLGAADAEGRASKNVWRWQSIGGFCLGKWCEAESKGDSNEAVPLSYSEASWTGLYNFRRYAWDEGACALLSEEARRALPPLADFHEGRLLNRLHRKRWPLLRDARFLLAVGDGAAANIGSGCVDASSIAATMGTSTAARVVVPHPDAAAEFRVPQGLFCYHIDASLLLVGGALTDGGSMFAWLSEALRLPADLESALAKRRIGDHGLSVMPFLNGERATGYHSEARAAILGLTGTTTPLDIFAASMEGVALRLAEIIRRLESLAAPRATLVASGTCIQSSRFLQRCLALFCPHLQLEVHTEPEATCLGVAQLCVMHLREDHRLAAMAGQGRRWSRRGTKYEQTQALDYATRHREAYEAYVTRERDRTQDGYA